jgi:acetyl-CoA carboxylase biotin carboxylase subunit
VKEQIRIAAGERLEWRQEDVRLRGAAIECRIYAEDPTNNFFPSPGYITRLQVPAGPGVRRDSGVYEGWTVPLEYDPLLSKVSVWGTARAEAMARMRRALGEYEVFGVKTNIPFFRRLLVHPDFTAGRLDTGLIDRVLAAGLMEEEPPSPEEERVAALAAALYARGRQEQKVPEPVRASAWKSAGREAALNRWPRREGWRSG